MKSWTNFECSFETLNTVNNFGNTKYLIFNDRMVRTAKINLVRAPAQILIGNPSICYIDSNQLIYGAIMNQGDDSKIKIVSVNGNVIYVKVEGVAGPNGNYMIGECSRIPANGYFTFDFDNDDGSLSHVHIGHGVINLIPGRPPVQALYDRVMYQLKHKIQ